MSKHPTPAEWAAQYREAWRALCEGKAAVMPIDVRNRSPRTNLPVQTTSRNLAFRLDDRPRRKARGYTP